MPFLTYPISKGFENYLIQSGKGEVRYIHTLLVGMRMVLTSGKTICQNMSRVLQMFHTFDSVHTPSGIYLKKNNLKF